MMYLFEDQCLDRRSSSVGLLFFLPKVFLTVLSTMSANVSMILLLPISRITRPNPRPSALTLEAFL